MRYLDRARSIVRGIYGISLPDPDRIDIGAVPDTVTLLEAIDAAMPRTAVLELIGPRHKALVAFLASCSIATRQSTNACFVSLADGTITELARVVTGCAANEVCSHLLVHDGDLTLLEAFGRDRGEDVVWLSRRLPRARLRQFLQVLSPSPPATEIRAPVRVMRQPWRMHALSPH
jgi:hypothetical protein